MIGEKILTTREILIATITTISLFIAVLIFFPLWNVWKKGLEGQAELKKAEFSKQVLIQTAKAEEEAAKYRAAAIKIMGEIAQKYPEYRKQEFIQAFGEALREGSIDQIIYIPTEATIPITEAK